MNEWEAVAIEGSAPAPSGVVQVIVLDRAQKRIGALALPSEGRPSFSASYPEEELDRLIQGGERVSSVASRAGLRR